mgnify:CR=1 FL=1
MSHKQLRNHKSQENTLVEISRFEPAEGVAEYHVMIHVTQPSLTYQEQLDTLLDTYYQLLENELKGAVAVFKRYFLKRCCQSGRLAGGYRCRKARSVPVRLWNSPPG